MDVSGFSHPRQHLQMFVQCLWLQEKHDLMPSLQPLPRFITLKNKGKHSEEETSPGLSLFFLTNKAYNKQLAGGEGAIILQMNQLQFWFWSGMAWIFWTKMNEGWRAHVAAQTSRQEQVAASKRCNFGIESTSMDMSYRGSNVSPLNQNWRTICTSFTVSTARRLRAYTGVFSEDLCPEQQSLWFIRQPNGSYCCHWRQVGRSSESSQPEM